MNGSLYAVSSVARLYGRETCVTGTVYLQEAVHGCARRCMAHVSRYRGVAGLPGAKAALETPDARARTRVEPRSRN